MTLEELINLLEDIFAYEPGVPAEPWSIIELDLNATQIAEIQSIPPELDSIIAEGQAQRRNYQIANIGNFSLLEVVAMSTLLAEVYEIRDRANANAYQQTIFDMDWSNRFKMTYFRNIAYPGNDVLTERHNDMISSIIERLNLRNAYNLAPAQRPYQKTYLLQSGLTKSEWIDIIDNGLQQMPAGPQIAQMLHGDDCTWRSEHFVQTWWTLYQYQQGNVSRGASESELSESHWVPRFWIKNLLDRIESIRDAQQGLLDVTHAESGCRNSPLTSPKLLWNQVPFFETSIDSRVLNRICPPACNALRITGPHGVIGQIARTGNGQPWQRVSGAYLTPGLVARIAAQGLHFSEVTVEIHSLNLESEFFTEIMLRLWHDDAILSRYNPDGLLELDAWHNRIPANRPITLAVPTGWTITPIPFQHLVLEEAGIQLAHFNGGQRPICVKDESNSTWWDSQSLEAPSKRIPLQLRQLKVNFVIDQRRATYVTGHLWVGQDFFDMINSVKIGACIMNWTQARTANAIRVGTDGIRNESLWGGLKVELQVSYQNQLHKVLRTARPRSEADAPIFLARSPDGAVTRVSDITCAGTVSQFRMTDYRMIPPRHLPRVYFYQNGQIVGEIDDKVARWQNVHHMGIPFQYSHETGIPQNRDLPVLMQGVVEQGCIASVKLQDTPNGSKTLTILLTSIIEPSPENVAHQGHHVLVLLRRNAEDGALLSTQSVNAGGIHHELDGDWGVWKLDVPSDSQIICGVAIAYGTTMIGSWVDDQRTGVRQLLVRNEIHADDVVILSDFLRLFNPPVFKIGFENDARTFFQQYKEVFQRGSENQNPVIWGGVKIQSTVNSPSWHLILGILGV